MKAPTPLKPLDIVVLVALVEWGDSIPSQANLAEALQIAPGTLSRVLSRLRDSSLITNAHGSLSPISDCVVEYFLYGVKYSFPAYIGSTSRGIPTAHSAPILSQHIRSTETYVWPAAFGGSAGTAVSPIHETVPFIANVYDDLYEWYALLDALRVGKAREVDIAEKIILDRLDIQ